jgi:hypothetical protein
MPTLINLTGKKINRWTVIERSGAYNDGDAKWLCKCECGSIREVSGKGLRKGSSKSCGCYKREVNEKQGKILGAFGKVHGMEGTRLYRIWHGMKNRCNNVKVQDFASYGGRGITYCAEWGKFIPFMEWALANGYEEELQIDRIDSNGNYEPSNCRWVTPKDNCNNRRNNIRITINGTTQTQAEWAEQYGMSSETIYQRRKRGWTGEKLIKKIWGASNV